MGELSWTPASQWGNEPEDITLPSGNRIVVHRPDLADLVMSDQNGSIPDGLLNQVVQQIESGKSVEPGEAWRPSRDDLPQMGKFIKLIVQSASVRPRIVDEPTPGRDDELAYRRVSTADRMYIFRWAMPAREVQAAGKFPGESETDVDAEPEMPAVSPEPVG
jgi:hypothetical protein